MWGGDIHKSRLTLEAEVPGQCDVPGISSAFDVLVALFRFCSKDYWRPVTDPNRIALPLDSHHF